MAEEGTPWGMAEWGTPTPWGKAEEGSQAAKKT